MSSITIWHNPRCSKSRQTLQLIVDHGIRPKVVEYLKTPPSAEELSQALAKLGLEPRDLMRTKEAAYEELGLGDQEMSRADLLDAMVAHPVLIERPVVFRGKRAVLGRPPENVLTLLD
jgi:arsenate reductase